LIVLGFDTATPATAVALALADGTTLRARDDPAAGERPGHTTRLLPLARELLAQAGLPWSAVELIAVGIGPGTFTGLRIGVSTARGLAQSLGVDAVGVSSLRVLAAAAFAAREKQGAGRGVLAAIDARRGEAYVAAYAREPGPPVVWESGATTEGEPSVNAAGGPESSTLELAPPRALAPQALAELLAQLGAGRDWLAVGDGAVRFRAQLEAVGVAVGAEDSALHLVDAGALCELARAQPRGALETLLPDYRRRPDAEIALEKVEQ
jgi:tRNA threonylcarbamoyladenosine biosynthesis protein TsaB